MMETLPVIEMSALFDRGDTAGRARVAGAIAQACEAHGFFYLTGHGIGLDVLDDLEAQSRRFFARPQAEKLKIDMARGGRAWRGFFPVGGELTSGVPDLKEGLYLGTDLAADHPRVRAHMPLHGANLWPAGVPELQLAAEAYMAGATRAAAALMEGFSISLGLDDDYFRDTYTREPTVLFRIFHYPATPPSDGRGYAFGVGEHTDYGLLTLLAQDDNGGLQIKGRDGVWFDAPPIPGTLVCNIGDMLDRLTRGVYRSAPHRVINTSGQDRLSWPLFFDPAFDAVVEPLPLEATAGREARWDAADLDSISGPYGDYLLGKVGKVFPELGKRVL